MRNLKKVLALVLALAMALSVMASAFTAPEYTPEAEAELAAMTAAQKDAFYVLNALEIVEGYGDGSFRPDGTLTRAEFAKMVYCAKTGDVAKENALFANASVIFTDAIDTWAIPYVAYAYSTGIVAGYPDGTFKATKAVTGLEAAKMLLTALGYDAEIEGLVGPTFYANTIKLATAAGLFNGVKGDIYAPATRADAFVMFANALKANTVSYVGGVATPKTETLNSEDVITLGEEGFDLLDVEAILVATDKYALNVYWRNVVNGNAAEGYLEKYQKAPEKYARFVYRDYVATNAANQGATYVDRLITVYLGDQVAKFAELGQKYRLLVTDMSPVFNENEYRVMYGYPVECENDGYYKVSTGKLADAADIVKAMRADTTIFANKNSVSAEKALELIEANKNSTATYKAIDNDNDGVVDTLFFNYYTIAIVKAVDGNKLTMIGVGTKTVADATDIAVGDYVAYWVDGDGEYVKELETKEANVTGWNGSAYTIDGAKYTFSSYINDGAKSLLGNAAAAITETVYKFVFDGSYIVNVELTANTRFAKYALVWEAALNENYLGYPLVKLYTEDNEVVNAYVKTLNGIEVRANSYANYYIDLEANDLVSYTLDGEYVYLDVIGQGRQGTEAEIAGTYGELSDTFDGNTVSDAYDFIYNRATDTWEGTASAAASLLNSTISMKDTHGVVFVSYKGGAAGTFRAYYNGEFQPNYYTADEAALRDYNNDLVVFATQNGMNYIKAAVITFDHPFYALPGLPTTRANDNFVIIKDVDVEKTSEGWVYTYTTYAAGSTATETYTSVPFAYQQAQPKANTVWNLKANADGKVTALEAIDLNFDGFWAEDADGVILEDTANILGTNGVEMYGYYVTSFNRDVYGNMTMTLSDVTSSMFFTGAVANTATINVSADADVWYFNVELKAGKLDSFAAKELEANMNYYYNNDPDGDTFVAYVDMNPTTQTANRVILMSGNFADAIAETEVAIKAEIVYDFEMKTLGFVALDTPANSIFNSIIGETELPLTINNLPACEFVEFIFVPAKDEIGHELGGWKLKTVKTNDGIELINTIEENSLTIDEDGIAWTIEEFYFDDRIEIAAEDICLVYFVELDAAKNVTDAIIVYDEFEDDWADVYEDLAENGNVPFYVIDSVYGEGKAIAFVVADVDKIDMEGNGIIVDEGFEGTKEDIVIL